MTSDDENYTDEEFQNDMRHIDVARAYQEKLAEELGRPVSFLEAEAAAYD